MKKNIIIAIVLFSYLLLPYAASAGDVAKCSGFGCYVFALGITAFLAFLPIGSFGLSGIIISEAKKSAKIDRFKKHFISMTALGYLALIFFFIPIVSSIIFPRNLFPGNNFRYAILAAFILLPLFSNIEFVSIRKRKKNILNYILILVIFFASPIFWFLFTHHQLNYLLLPLILGVIALLIWSVVHVTGNKDM